MPGPRSRLSEKVGFFQVRFPNILVLQWQISGSGHRPCAIERRFQIGDFGRTEALWSASRRDRLSPPPMHSRHYARTSVPQPCPAMCGLQEDGNHAKLPGFDLGQPCEGSDNQLIRSVWEDNGVPGRRRLKEPRPRPESDKRKTERRNLLTSW